MFLLQSTTMSDLDIRIEEGIGGKVMTDLITDILMMRANSHQDMQNKDIQLLDTEDHLPTTHWVVRVGGHWCRVIKHGGSEM